MADPVILSAAFIHAGIKDTISDGATLEQKAEACMKASLDDSYTWMLCRDDDKFKAGVGALLLLVQDDLEAKARVEHEIHVLGAVNEMLSGDRFDGDAMAELVADGAPKPIGMMSMFRVTVEERQ